MLIFPAFVWHSVTPASRRLFKRLAVSRSIFACSETQRPARSAGLFARPTDGYCLAAEVKPRFDGTARRSSRLVARHRVASHPDRRRQGAGGTVSLVGKPLASSPVDARVSAHGASTAPAAQTDFDARASDKAQRSPPQRPWRARSAGDAHRWRATICWSACGPLETRGFTSGAKQ